MGAAVPAHGSMVVGTTIHLQCSRGPQCLPDRTEHCLRWHAMRILRQETRTPLSGAWVWGREFDSTPHPSCASTRALCAFSHGYPPQAVAFNANLLVTAPVMLALIFADTGRLVRKMVSALPASLNSLREMSGVFKPE